MGVHELKGRETSDELIRAENLIDEGMHDEAQQLMMNFEGKGNRNRRQSSNS